MPRYRAAITCSKSWPSISTVRQPKDCQRAAGFSCEGHADARGESLTEGSCGHVETRKDGHVRVPLKARIDGVESQQLLLREVSAQSRCRIKADRTVSLRQDKAITVRVLWIGGVDVHHVEIQGRKDLGCGHGTTKVTGAGVMD